MILSELYNTSLSFNNKWNKRYIELAKLISTWSKDTTKVGAVCVSNRGRILSVGYNGFPRGVEDSEARLKDRDTKLKFIVHAEQNAIYNAGYNGVKLDKSSIYISGLPVCSECAKAIIQAGIENVYMLDINYPEPWVDNFKLSYEMFKESGIGVTLISDGI
jgi:dCMP deaminase